MSGSDRALTGLLRWYPPAWRDRYGRELVALMEDDLDGRRPTLRFRASLAASGVRQRTRSAGVTGDGVPPSTRVRAGALVVLVAWAGLLLGGAAFAKLSEHYDTAVLAHGHHLAVAAHDAVVVLATIGVVLVLSAIVTVMPATWRFLRSGGWTEVRRPVAIAVALSVAALLATVGLVAWAHDLTYHARNGGNAAYGAAFVAWVAVVATTLASWTSAAIALARRLDLVRTTVRIEAALAVAVAVVIALVSVAIGLWWAAMAQGATWFLAGTRPGTHPSALTVPLVILAGWLAVATATAGYGATRATRSLHGA